MIFIHPFLENYLILDASAQLEFSQLNNESITVLQTIAEEELRVFLDRVIHSAQERGIMVKCRNQTESQTLSQCFNVLKEEIGHYYNDIDPSELRRD